MPNSSGFGILLTNGKFLLRMDGKLALLSSAATAVPAPPPTPTGVFPLAFAGAAGAPTGSHAYASIAGSAPSQNGSGGLVFDGTYSYGMLLALGAVADGSYTLQVAVSPSAGAVYLGFGQAGAGAPAVLAHLDTQYRNAAIDGVFSTPDGSLPTVNATVSLHKAGNTYDMLVDGASLGGGTGATLTGSVYLLIGGRNVTVTGITYISPAQAAAAAQAAFLAGNPVTNPRADGFAPGIYFPETVYIPSGIGVFPTLATGFVRFASGRPWTTVLVIPPAITNTLYLAGPNALSLTGYFMPAVGTYAATITASDGHGESYTQAVTIISAVGASANGGNFILNTEPDVGNGRRRFVNGFDPTSTASAVTFFDPNGLVAPDGRQLATTPAGQPISAHYGAHTGAVFHVAGQPDQAHPYWFAQEQPASMDWTPNAAVWDWQPTLAEFAQNVAPTGAVVGRIRVSCDTDVRSLRIITAGAPLSIRSDGTVYAARSLTAGNLPFTVRVMSFSGVTTDLACVLQVQAGTALATTNLTTTITPNLHNFLTWQCTDPTAANNYDGIAARLVVAGLTAPITWEMHVSSDECQALGLDVGQGVPAPRYELSSGTGTSVNLMAHYLSAQTDVVEVRASDATGRVVHATIAMVIPKVAGGRQVTLGPAGTGTTYDFNLADDLINAVWANPTLYAGGKCTIFPGLDFSLDWSRPDYAHGQTTAGGGFRKTWFPCPFELAGSAPFINMDFKGHAPALSLQGALAVQTFDMTIRNLTIRNVNDNFASGTPNAAAIIKTNGSSGNLNVIDCHIYNADDGFLGGAEGNHILFQRVTFGWCGIGDYGLTHAPYVGHASSVVFDHCVFIGVTSANEIKSRAARTTLLNCRSLDTNNGNGSTQLDLSVGGIVFIQGGVYWKGPNPNNNGNIIQFAVEAGARDLMKPTWPHNTLTVDGATIMATVPSGALSSAVSGVKVGQLSDTGGIVEGSTTNEQISGLITNCKFYGLGPADWSKGWQYGIPAITLGGGNVQVATFPTIDETDPTTGAAYTDVPGPSYSQYANMYGGITVPPMPFVNRIAAGAPIGTTILPLAVFDDFGAPLTNCTWALSAYDAAKFSIVSAGNTATLKNAAAVTDGRLYVSVSVSGTSPNQGARSSSRNLCIIAGTGAVALLA